MIDTHAHLDALDRVDDVLARAREAGVMRILTVGMAQAVALAERFDNVFAIVGIHPHESADGDLDEVKRLQAHPKAVAVGETGLDWFRDYAPRDAQRRVFAAQLDLARELGK
ncbi:MAG TPA: TatD family hydrolase, partial [Gaiellaceae bacterium]|nr:TatD family hydrolase [Gaiellaceae bacterium]